MDVINLLAFSERAQLRQWFEANHDTARQCWVVSYVKQQPKWTALPYHIIVEEALCFGWIDSTKKKLPDGRVAQRLSPRRDNSHWTALNIYRCESLERRGLMTDAGRKALARQGSGACERK